MNWGKWIVVAFLSFTVFITVLVVVCFREDVSLVSAHYYEDDLQYQKQYEQVGLAASLSVKPEIYLNDTTLFVRYQNFGQVEYGTLTLMRPSDAKLDHTFQLLNKHDSVQQFILKHVEPGLYKVNLIWKEKGITYRIDKSLVL